MRIPSTLTAQFLVAAFLAMLPVSVSAQESEPEPCLTSTTMTGRLNDLLTQWTDFNVPEAVSLCEKLNAVGAGLWIVYDSGELEGRSFGWVIITLQDEATGVEGMATYNTITLSEDLGQVEQDGVLRESLEHGLRAVAVDADHYIMRLQEDVTALRQAHGPQ